MEVEGKKEGQLTLNQMLKALDKDVATGIEKRLKKLSKKKAIKAPLSSNQAAKIERIAAYSDVSKEVSKWQPIVDRNKKAKQLRFPLDQEPDVLPSTAGALANIEPRNAFENHIQAVITTSGSAQNDEGKLSKSEEKYLKAISVEEAAERHKELQRMRVLLNSYAAKMRRQKTIKSKSYRRLLKQERIKNHMKRVESDKDSLMNEIEKLQRLRAQERASLKHKNTGKWAKHAKFRAKYDENARKAMLEQIGIAEKFLKRPAQDDSDDTDDSDEGGITDDEISETDSKDQEELPATQEPTTSASNARLIVSSELIDKRSSHKRRDSENDDDCDDDDDDDDEVEDKEGDDPQRQLMSEAFAGDDVVKEFKAAKRKIADEEQPKDVDLFLPGWGDWAGPGLKVSKKKRKKYIIKAKKIPRKDSNLGNVIISEQANEATKDMLPTKLPRGIKSEKQLNKLLTQPIAATFVGQARHRELTQPRIVTKMGAKIEPINKKVLQGGNKAKWA